MPGPFCSAWKTPTRQIAIWARTATIFAMCSVRWSTPSSCWPCQRTTPASATPCSAASSNGTSDGIGIPIPYLSRGRLVCVRAPFLALCTMRSANARKTGSRRCRSCCTYVAPAGDLSFASNVMTSRTIWQCVCRAPASKIQKTQGQEGKARQPRKTPADADTLGGSQAVSAYRQISQHTRLEQASKRRRGQVCGGAGWMA